MPIGGSTRLSCKIMPSRPSTKDDDAGCSHVEAKVLLAYFHTDKAKLQKHGWIQTLTGLQLGSSKKTDQAVNEMHSYWKHKWLNTIALQGQSVFKSLVSTCWKLILPWRAWVSSQAGNDGAHLRRQTLVLTMTTQQLLILIVAIHSKIKWQPQKS